MIFSKLLVLVLCCQLSTHSCATFNCDFSNRCHPYGSSWWDIHANICLRCSNGKKYHCARDYDSPYGFREGCAVEKICPAGEEPRISFKESGKAVTEPVVYCDACYDTDYYNSKSRPSSEYSECPDKKWNDCSKEKHKILCKPDDSTDERFCRCDARNGYSPYNDLSNEKCSFKDYDCRDYKKCHDLPSGKPQQLLLNYTCAERCDEGFDRRDENSDVCLPIPKSTTTRKPTSVSSTKQEITSTTVAPTKAPVPTTTLKLECDEECGDYSICYNGTCICPDSCPVTDEPVCGYNAESDGYRTFSSKCDLERIYCVQKQYDFSSEGECETSGSNPDLIGGAIGGSLGFIILFIIAFVIFYKSSCGQKCRRKFWPYPEMFYVVIKFTSLQFTEEIRAAGQDIGGLPITQQLETALQTLFSSLRGSIRVRIVGFQSGSLMVKFYIDTDGKATQREIVQLLNQMLSNGKLRRHSVSTEGFEFRRIGDPMEIIVPPPTAQENVIVIPPPRERTVNTVTVVDGQKPNGRHTDRQLSAPLSEPEDVSTPNLSSGARKPTPSEPEDVSTPNLSSGARKPAPSEPEDVSTPNLSSGARKPTPPTIVYNTTNIYRGPVIKSKGGNTQIAFGGGSKNKNVKMMYNKQDIEEGEDQLLLGDEVTETEFNREDSKYVPDFEDCNQRTVEVHKADELFHTNGTTCTQSIEKSTAADLKDCSGVSAGTSDDGATRANPTSELMNVEADSEGKLRTKKLSEKQTLGISKSANFCRRTSVSQDSVFSPPTIQDVENLFEDSDEYKKLIDRVMDICLKSLLADMDPMSMLDMFTVKEMFDHTFRRDIFDMKIQTDRSRKIVSKIRETGKQYYQDFKVCLRQTKQYSCLAEVEKVQSEVLAKMGKCVTQNVPERSRHNSVHRVSLPDLRSVSESEIFEPEFSETKTDDNSDIIYKRASGDILEEETFVGLESTSPVFPELEKNPTGNTPMVPTDDTQAPQKSKRRPTFVPPVEETVEEMAQKHLIELSNILKVDSRGKMIKSGEMYEKFQEKCKQIKRQLPGLTAELLLQEQRSTNPLVPEYYQNTPEGFQAYKSSGKDNSCLYQSVALLLVGSEKLQFSLRLLATLHAVESFRLYKKQLLMMHLENLKLFFSRHINDSTLEEISLMDDDESVTDLCLQILIMETACLGTDSSVLHVGFLSGALGVNIHQHFQQNSEYGKDLKIVPWEKIIQDLQVNSDLPDLHIFWVNYNKIENGIMNHIVPLKQKDIT